LLHIYLQRLEAELSGGPRIAVLAAAEAIPLGASLAEKTLSVREIPQAYVESRQVRAADLKKVIGARMVSSLKPNEVLLWNDLNRYSDQSRVLSSLIQNGMRAVPISGQAASFEGLLRPGDRVDVVLTTSEKEGLSAKTVTLLQNLLVLSVGADLVHEPDQNKRGTEHGSVTLSATVEQAQVLAQAAQRGRLILTLRNAEDIAIVEGVPETNLRDLLGIRDKLETRFGKAATKGMIEHVR
jgi:pilus assembly protein CpaB